MQNINLRATFTARFRARAGTPEDFDWRVPSSAYEDCSGLSPHDLCLLYPFVFSSSAPIPVKIRAGSTVLTSVPQVKMMVDVFF